MGRGNAFNIAVQQNRADFEAINPLSKSKKIVVVSFTGVNIFHLHVELILLYWRKTWCLTSTHYNILLIVIVG